jgi:hypothetical protein
MANGPNPVLLVRDHLDEHIAELEAERRTIVEKLMALNAQLVAARTLRDVVPPPRAPEHDEPLEETR